MTCLWSKVVAELGPDPNLLIIPLNSLGLAFPLTASNPAAEI